MGKLSRDKGKVGEREVAALLREYGFDGKRGVQYQGGKDSADVTGLPGFHIEVKRTEKFALEAALAQAREDCGPNTPVVFHRKSKYGWVVVMDADDFLKEVKTRASLGAALLRGAEHMARPHVVVKDQPEDSDWERMKERVAELAYENRRLQDELEQREETF